MERSAADITGANIDSTPTPSAAADTTLLRSAADGDSGAFNQLVDRYKDRLFNHIRRRVRDTHQAEDLTQETFLRFFRAAQSRGYTAQASVITWLFTIASNCVTDHLRAQTRRPTIPLNGNERMSTGNAAPVERMVDRESHLMINRALESLPKEQREVIELKLIDGLTFGEIAELLGCPITTAKSRMAYGLRKIEQALREQQRQEI